MFSRSSLRRFFQQPQHGRPWSYEGWNAAAVDWVVAIHFSLQGKGLKTCGKTQTPQMAKKQCCSLFTEFICTFIYNIYIYVWFDVSILFGNTLMGSCTLAVITIGHMLIRISCTRFSEGEAITVSVFRNIFCLNQNTCTWTFQFGCQMVALQGVNSTCFLGFNWHPLEGAGMQTWTSRWHPPKMLVWFPWDSNHH